MKGGKDGYVQRTQGVFTTLLALGKDRAVPYTPKRLFEKQTAITVQCYTDSVRMSAK